jgi:hypothetical protein
MKKIIVASLLLMPLFWGCQKETLLSKPVKAPAAETAKTLHCSPWREVYGYNALISELNAFAVCNTTACSGNSVTSSATSGVLNDPNGDPYLFSGDEEITIAKQSEIMGQASIWAAAYMPAGGYFVSGITYQVPPGEYLSNAVGIGIIVTYRKCTGGGGGEHS